MLCSLVGRLGADRAQDRGRRSTPPTVRTGRTAAAHRRGGRHISRVTRCSAGRPTPLGASDARSERRRVELRRVDVEGRDRLGDLGRQPSPRTGRARPAPRRRCAAGRSRTGSGAPRGCRSGRSRRSRATRSTAAASATTMSGRAFIQSVAATIGPPSGPRTVETYGTRARLGRVEPVPALRLEGVAAEERERRRRVDLGRDPGLLGEEVARGDHLLEDRARPDEPRPVGLRPEIGRLGEAVDARG